MLQQAVPMQSLWRLLILCRGWLTLLSTISTVLSAAEEAEAGSLQLHYILRKTSTAPAIRLSQDSTIIHSFLCTSFAQTSGGSKSMYLEFYHVCFSHLGFCPVWQHHRRHCRSFNPISNGVYFPCSPPSAAPTWSCLSAEGRRCNSWHPYFCPSNASILCQAPPRVSSLQFTSGNWLYWKATICNFSLAFLLAFCDIQ